MYVNKEITEEQVLRWDYKQTKKCIIHPDFMVDNKEIMQKKRACNEARSSWEEHVGMRDSMRKGDFEHSNE